MATTPIPIIEPEIFDAGDTLWFEKYLANYLPSAGWSLLYVLTDLNGAEVAQVASVASDSDATRHKIYQDNFAAGLDDGDYIFTGYRVNGAERHRIYQQVLALDPNYGAGTVSQPEKTFAQQAIEALQSSLLDLYKTRFAETDVQRNRFKLQDQSKVLEDLRYWREVRNWEIRQQQLRNGQPAANDMRPVLRMPGFS